MSMLSALSRCAVVGMLHGSLAGVISGLLMAVQPPGPVPLAAVPIAALVVFAVVLAVSLFLLVCIERFYLSQILAPTVLNAAIVVLVVVAVVTRLPPWTTIVFVGWLVGTLLGWLIGALLCRLSCGGTDASTR